MLNFNIFGDIANLGYRQIIPNNIEYTICPLLPMVSKRFYAPDARRRRLLRLLAWLALAAGRLRPRPAPDAGLARPEPAPLPPPAPCLALPPELLLWLRR